jgi:methionyl-tRNA formyltransferase
MRILLIGDTYGVPQVLRTLPPDSVIGIVAASNRPQHHESLAGLAADRNVPFLIQPPWRSADSPAFIEAISRLDPDVIVCNSYSMLLRPDVLAVPRLGSVNLHFGRLPEFRGPNPLQWAIIEDERSTAATLHWMSPEIDAGDVIADVTIEIGFDDRWRDVWARLDVAADQLLRDVLPLVLTGTAPRRPQDGNRTRVRRRRTPNDGRIDWDTGVLAVYNLIRALGDGLPPAFYETEGGRVELDRRVTLAEVTALSFAPGPGQRRLAASDVSLVPISGAELRFRAIGGAASIAELRELDTERRAVTLWTDRPDEAAESVLTSFATTDLGFGVR